jgi:hypothetical protein
MARQEVRFEVDGETYKLTQLGALEGRRIWLRLLKVLVHPIRSLATAGRLNESALVDALALAVENLDEATAEALYIAFGKACSVRVVNEAGEKWPTLEGVVFDNHFAGNYVAMSQWLGQCVVLNFGNFIGGNSLGSLSDLLQKAGGRSPSPKASTGSSGESSHTNAAQ